jgi:DNA-binding LacI/PurR family transcriptional regulator
MTTAQDAGRGETGKPTIYDVAAHAKVSISTVSQTINRPTRVHEATRTRVLKSISDLGYVPKPAAVSQARRGVGRIGVVSPFSSYESYSRRLVGILEETAGTNCDVVVYDHESAAAAVSPLLRSLPIAGRLDGLLIMGLPVDDMLVADLMQRRLPTVLIDSARPEFSSVNVDDDRGGMLVAQHLLALGHKSFAWVQEAQASHEYLSPADRRRSGLVRTLVESGLKASCLADVVTTNDIRGGRDALDRILAMKDGPRAIFAHHDTLAAGIVLEARSRNLRLRDDIAVVGFDDSSNAEAVGLTTVRQPFKESGRVGAALLTGEIRASLRTVQHTLLGIELVVRDT